MKTRSNLPFLAAAGVVLAVAVGVLAGRTVLAPKAPAGSPQAAAGPAKPARLPVDDARLATAGIRLAVAETGRLAAEVIAQGTVSSPPGAAALVSARADGAVTRITKRLGDPVRAGETIALVESREGAAIVADRSTAAAKAVAARNAYRREKRLFEARITARQDLEAAQAELAAAEAELRRASVAGAAAHVTGDGRYIAVTSPITGRVAESAAVLGAYVQAGTVLFRVTDPGRLEIQAAIPALDSARIAPGDPAWVELADGSALPAVVRSVSPALDAQTRAAGAVLDLTGTGARLEPGQALRVRIRPRVAGAGASLVVPDEAVQSIDGRDVVFVRVGKAFEVRPVSVGARGGGRAEIVSGLRAGETVAGRGAFLLKAELGKGAEEEE